MDIRYIMNPYISMDDLSKLWELNHCLIINPEYLKQINDEKKEDNEEKGLTLTKGKNIKN